MTSAFDATPEGVYALRPRWDEPGRAWRGELLGHNTVWCRGGLGAWDEREREVNPEVLEATRAMRPGALRLPGGTRAMRWRFDETLGPVDARRAQCDPFRGVWDATTYGLREAMTFATLAGARVALVAPWVDGSPEATAAMVAYVRGDPSCVVPLGVDAHGRDWGVAGDWAARRVRGGREAPWDAPWLEVGNEPYLPLPVGPDDACGRPGRFRQCEQWILGRAVPTTARRYADALRRTADLVRAVDPSMRIGAAALGGLFDDEDPRDAVAATDAEEGSAAPWNPTLRALAGDAFDFWCAHVYVVEPTEARSRLAARVDATLAALGEIDGRPCALTEHGFFLGADTLRNAIASAQVVAVCAARDALYAARHLLLEDDPTGPFASCAAILGPDRRRTPAWHATRMIAEALEGRVVPCAGAVASAAEGTIGLALGARHAGLARIALPPGRWRGEASVLSDHNVDAREVAPARTEVQASGELRVPLPGPSVLAVTLRREG
jgi:hypothetical protein